MRAHRRLLCAIPTTLLVRQSDRAEKVAENVTEECCYAPLASNEVIQFIDCLAGVVVCWLPACLCDRSRCIICT
jgi:hypothetical protein